MSCSFRKFDLIGELSDTDTLRALAQDIKDRRGPLDCLDKIVRLRTMMWGHLGVPQCEMAFLIILLCKILSRFFSILLPSRFLIIFFKKIDQFRSTEALPSSDAVSIKGLTKNFLEYSVNF